MKIFLYLPFPVSLLIITSVCIILFFFIQKIIRKKISHEMLIENHEIGGFIYNAIGIIYAVLVAFVVFAIWTDYKETETKIEIEANNLVNLYTDASVYPDTMKKEIQTTISDYIENVIHDEWRFMAAGYKDTGATQSFIRLNKLFLSINSDLLKNKEALSMSMDNLNELRDCRRHRILSSKEHMPDILWIVLIIGAVILIVFTLFFSTKNKRHLNIMSSLLIFICVLVLYLIFVLDHPFVGRNGIKPGPFVLIENMLKNSGNK
jgi:hypothetical protein